jgi:uncharacterized membrane protein YgdD (TMEM256/DUF423 family)
MTWTRPLWLRLAAISGFISVAVGAFAAHVVKDPAAKELLHTGSTYEAIHALATIVCAVFVGRAAARARVAAALFLAGSALFSGSLYALAAGAPRIVGAITPLGGLAFLGGWAVLAWAAGAERNQE